jgi:hypothetical protein
MKLKTEELSARFGSMTVNERLFVAGSIDAWDKALRKRDRLKMISILSAVELGDQAAEIADAALANQA